MTLNDLALGLRRLSAPLPMWSAVVDSAQWTALAQWAAATGGRLVSVWGSLHDTGAARSVSAAYAVADGLVWARLPLADPAAGYPDLVPLFACASRMQRAAADLTGVRAEAAADTRPWLDHGLWSPGPPPLSVDGVPQPAAPGTLPADYAFVRVEGDGVHEIAVGPVHAGIIEPGHFRFSVVGEKVLRLEQHLGYKHKGIERRFTELDPLQAYRLAGRISGDSTVAYAWAYAMALESACASAVPGRAQWLRALLLERERVANHLGDLGALGNDAALAFGLAQFSRLREDWQRASLGAFGHRFMMDAVVPGGVAGDLGPSQVDTLRRQCDTVQRDVQMLRGIYEAHSGLQDRFMTTGRVWPDRAAKLGLTGMVGRASGQAFDLRCDLGWAPYDRLQVRMATQQTGDAAARVAVRFDELLESLRLVREILAALPTGSIRIEPALPAKAGCGLGCVEAWRGPVLVALQLTDDARIARCHAHDPSWQNWPVLEHAVIGDIVADFPIINKSFNLSYSGQDL